MQWRLGFKRGQSKCSLTKTDNGGRTPADLRCIVMAMKCLHIPQTPRVPHMEALLYAYSSVEIRPARNITYSTSFFVNRWESAGSLGFPIPPWIPVPLPSRGPVYRCLFGKVGMETKRNYACNVMIFNLLLLCRPTIMCGVRNNMIGGRNTCSQRSHIRDRGPKKRQGKWDKPGHRCCYTWRMSSGVSPILRGYVHPRQGPIQLVAAFSVKRKTWLAIISTDSSRRRSLLLLSLGTGLLWLKTMKWRVFPFLKELVKSVCWNWVTGEQHPLQWHQRRPGHVSPEGGGHPWLLSSWLRDYLLEMQPGSAGAWCQP